MAVTFFVPASAGFLTDIVDRAADRYYRISIDVNIDGNFVDVTSSVILNSITGGSTIGQGSTWQVALRNVGGTYQEGSLAGCPVKIEAQVNSQGYITIFTGYVDRKGANRSLIRKQDDTIVLKLYDYTKHTGNRKKASFFSFINFKIADTTATGSSIFHKLALDMGLTAGQLDVYATLDYTKDYLPIQEKSTSYKELQLLSDAYLGTLNFRYDGKLKFVSPFMDGYTTPASEWTFDENNIHTIQSDGGDVLTNYVKTNYDNYEALGNRVIHKNLTLWNALFSYNEIPVLAGEYWPGGTVEGKTASLKYKDPNTGEDWPIGTSIQTPDIGAYGTGDYDIECSGGVLTLHSFNGVTGTDASLTEREPDGAQIILKNTTGSTITIRKMEIQGDPLRILSKNTIKSIDNSVSSDDVIEKSIEGKYMANDEQAFLTCQWWKDFGSSPRKRYTIDTDWLPIVQVGAVVTIDLSATAYPPSGISDTFVVERFTHQASTKTISTAKTRLTLLEHVPFSGAGSPVTVNQVYSGSAAPEKTDAIVADLTNKITYTETQTGFDVGGGTTTPTQVTILKCEPVGVGGVLLVWDVQLNLTNFDHYEIQVSSDDATWYSLEFDGTDFKDTLTATTDVNDAFLVHAKIPYTGTIDNPTGQLLYYRIRRVTKAPTNGTWSVSSSTTTLVVSPGDLAANSIYANNIIAAQINTLLLRATGAVIAGFAGSGSADSPLDYDRRSVMDDDEFRSEEYKDGAWNQNIIVGGAQSGRLLTSIKCNGLYTNTKLASYELLPSSSYKLFNFEESFYDSNNEIELTVLNAIRSTTSPKFGSYELRGSGSVPFLGYANYSTTTDIDSDFTICAWLYSDGTVDANSIQLSMNSNNGFFAAYNNTTNTVTFKVVKGGVTTNAAASVSVTASTWYFIAFSYVSSTNTVTLVINGETPETINPTGTWAASSSRVYYLNAINDDGVGNVYVNRMDDFVFSDSEAMSVTDMKKHYTNNVAWVPEITKDDMLIKSDNNIVLSADSGFIDMQVANYGSVIVTDDYTIPDNKGPLTIILSSAATDHVTVTLPDVASNPGRQITFINENATKDLTISRAGSDTINGMTSYEISAGYDYTLSFIAGSAEWRRSDKTFVIIPEASRPTDWILSAGTATTWTDVDFSFYAPAGVRCLLLKFITRWDGDATEDFSVWSIRENGSSVTDIEQLIRVGVAYTNMPAAVTDFGIDGQIIACCDADRIIEYKEVLATRTGGSLYLSIEGFYI